ncbi:MAG: hypothetical protein NPIRA06_25980 [Nitrospirales bacterium]|nr:MAG: hypothetical protein NPIRA06_25980 [Nitrospirales bacterium]
MFSRLAIEKKSTALDLWSSFRRRVVVRQVPKGGYLGWGGKVDFSLPFTSGKKWVQGKREEQQASK